MAKQEIEFIRDGRFIQVAGGGPKTDHKTVNAAKRWSRAWQKANGGMGIGRLVTAQGLRRAERSAS